MIQCIDCSWQGERHELHSHDGNYFDINNWAHCPKCNAIPALHPSLTTISSVYNGSVLSINPELTIVSANTFLHLGRMLDFVVNSKHLTILAYKKLTHTTFPLTIRANSFDFESIILLKIIHRAHLEKYKCETKTFNDYVYFGKWSRTDSIYPVTPCSFCARYYEWENKTSNSWPLSIEKIRKISNNVEKPVVPKNNKFAKIFGVELKKETKKQICICSEILRPHPCCDVHPRSN